METQWIKIEKWKIQAILIGAVAASLILGALIGRSTAYANQPMLSPLPTSFVESGNDPVLPSPIPTPKVIRGKASWYGNSDSECLGCSPNRITASGRKYDEMGFTAACAKRFALGQTLEVRYREKVVRVVCTDRGGFEKGYGRILDLSKASFAKLAPLGSGVIDVEVVEEK